jgi:hypothetical protein
MRIAVSLCILTARKLHFIKEQDDMIWTECVAVSHLKLHLWWILLSCSLFEKNVHVRKLLPRNPNFHTVHGHLYHFSTGDMTVVPKMAYMRPTTKRFFAILWFYYITNMLIFNLFESGDHRRPFRASCPRMRAMMKGESLHSLDGHQKPTPKTCTVSDTVYHP